MVKKKFDDSLEDIPFWKQILIWLISISLVSKVLDTFFYPNSLTFILKLLGGFFIGFVILTILKKK